MHDSGVIFAAENAPDFIECKSGVFAENVHTDLARNDKLAAALASGDIRNTHSVMVADGIDDHFRRRCDILVRIDHIAKCFFGVFQVRC